MTLKVLALDIEGGYGGSSRSLYETLRHLPPESAEVTVWCRRRGPIQPRYAALGLHAEVHPEIPNYSALPKFSRSMVDLAREGGRWLKGRRFRKRLLEAADEADVVHLNHEGLFLLARWLRPRTDAAIAVHVRTHLPSGAVAGWQYRILLNSVDRCVFITENERDRVSLLTGRRPRGRVVYNVVDQATPVSPDPALAEDKRFKVAVLSNFALVRGTDRIVEIAERLRDMGRRDIVFAVAGNMQLNGRLPGQLGEVARRGGTLANYAAVRGVGEYFVFLGHVERPEAVVAASDVVAKPTREANPWGRDILEGLAAGKPVMSVGTYNRFVETGVTGLLTVDFDAADWAREIVRLADEPERGVRMGRQGRARVAELCNGPARAQDLLDVWHEAVDERSRHGRRGRT